MQGPPLLAVECVDCQALKKLVKRFQQASSVMISPFAEVLVTVSMAADPLGTSDGHFLEVMPDFLREGKEMGPNTDKGCYPRAKENTGTLNFTQYLLNGCMY